LESVDWLSLIDRFGLLLREAEPGERIALYLKTMRDDFHWSLAEHWVARDGDYRITDESHVDLEPLNRFTRESASIVMPVAWVRPEGWRLDPTMPESASGRVFWGANAPLSTVTIRRGMIREAGLNAQVALPVPNRGYQPRMVMLFNLEPRRPTAGEVNALSIATFLLGWGGEQDSESRLDLPKHRAPVTHLDEQARCLTGPRGSVRLTTYEWDLLSIFFANPGRALSFPDLSQAVWRAPEEYVGRAVIYEVIGRLRKHLASVGEDYEIVNVPRFGYVLQHEAAQPLN
jgi:DNA-binding winged helix-turn-helix (wHTH) protein